MQLVFVVTTKTFCELWAYVTYTIKREEKKILSLYQVFFWEKKYVAIPRLLRAYLITPAYTSTGVRQV